MDGEVARDPRRRRLGLLTIQNVAGAESVRPRTSTRPIGNDPRSSPGRADPSRVGGSLPAPTCSPVAHSRWAARMDLSRLPRLVDPSPRQLVLASGSPRRGSSIGSITSRRTKSVFWSTTTYYRITMRTLGMAIAVTVADLFFAFPFAYYAARIAQPRVRTRLLLAVTIPLWANYLDQGVRVEDPSRRRWADPRAACPIRCRSDGVEHRRLDRLLLPLVPVRDVADLCRVGTCSGFLHRSVE